MVAVQDRGRYQPGFGVSLLRLPLFLILALLAAALAARYLKFAFFTGWYATILLPIFVALGLGGLLYVIVGWAHCRNRHLAAAVGIAAGAVGYLGYYQLCMNELRMARLVVQVEEGPRELLLSADPTTWAPVNNKARRRIAENLCQRINGLRG